MYHLISTIVPLINLIAIETTNFFLSFLIIFFLIPVVDEIITRYFKSGFQKMQLCCTLGPKGASHREFSAAESFGQKTQQSCALSPKGAGSAQREYKKLDTRGDDVLLIYIGTHLLVTIRLWFFILSNQVNYINAILICLTFGMQQAQSISAAHELIHHRKKINLIIGHIVLGLNFMNHFDITHRKIHHVYVGTDKDPSSGRRGQNLYYFLWQSIIGNLCLAPYDVLLFQILAYGGLLLILRSWIVFACTLVGIMVVETVNYMQHYGLDKGLSWDCENILTNLMLFNIGIHSDHHLNSIKPYSKLKINPISNKYKLGYLTNIFIAMCPPFWYRYVKWCSQ